jgi:hypothetical protein
MTDYNDYKVWKEVELYTHAEYLNERVGYQPEDLLELSSKLMTIAKEEGLQGCYLKFQSTMEPWEDFLGPVQLTICGYRKLNTKEKAEQARTEAIEGLAKEKGITFHEASTLVSLKERGKL